MLNAIEKKLSWKWFAMLGGFLCLNVLIFGLGYRKAAPEPVSEKERMPAYGERLGTLPGEVASYLKPGWRLLVVMLVDSTNPNPRLRYLDVVSRKYAEQGLKVVGLGGGTPEQRQEVMRRFGLSFPVVTATAEDIGDLRIATPFNHEGIIIIDSELRVKFADFETQSEDELRMLIEKYLLGDIDYTYRKAQPYQFFGPKQRIPPLRLEAISAEPDGTEILLTSEQMATKYLAVFLANCASCQLEGYMQRLAAFEKSAAGAKKKGIAVFAANFSRANLAAVARSAGVRTPVYILKSDIPELYSDYQTRYHTDDMGPLLVNFDHSGAVAGVRPLPKEER